MIVPDGHTDPEKLRQLLAAAEETHLDFKASLNFENKKDVLEFVKDVVAMANRPPGGYIVIGVDDDGHPCIPAGSLDKPEQFDGANRDLTPCVGHAQSQDVLGGSEMIQRDGKEKLSRRVQA